MGVRVPHTHILTHSHHSHQHCPFRPPAPPAGPDRVYRRPSIYLPGPAGCKGIADLPALSVVEGLRKRWGQRASAARRSRSSYTKRLLQNLFQRRSGRSGSTELAEVPTLQNRRYAFVFLAGGTTSVSSAEVLQEPARVCETCLALHPHQTTCSLPQGDGRLPPVRTPATWDGPERAGYKLTQAPQLSGSSRQASDAPHRA